MNSIFHQVKLVASLRCLLLTVVLLSLNVNAETYRAGEWKIEVSVEPDKPSIMLGEPVYLSFRVQNHSDEDLQILVGGDYRNALGRPESFTVKTVSSGGKLVAQSDSGMQMGGMTGPQKLPAQGSYVFRLFLPHWATFADPGNYSIQCQRKLQLLKPEAGKFFAEQKTTDIEVQASGKIEVTPADKRKMGDIIAQLGKTMLGNSGDAAETAARTLDSIQDDRVVPYYLRALDSKSYTLKFVALGALSKFDSRDALAGLKRGMTTRAEDMENATTREVTEQLARNIRHAAAAALAKSKHPEAVPFLLSQRHDESEAVRITVLHALGKMKSAEALSILKEMTEDKSKRVSDEAKRYVHLMTESKTP